MTNDLGPGASRAGFVARSQPLDRESVDRAIRRMGHEVFEHNAQSDVVIIGLQSGGVAFATRLAEVLREISGHPAPVGALDVSFFRDDLTRRPLRGPSVTDIPVDLSGRDVLIVDDVLFTGRTVRAALSALAEWGRPRAIQLAVMVDRGHRELPIRPDYVGKNLPTAVDDVVVATVEGVWIGVEDRP